MGFLIHNNGIMNVMSKCTWGVGQKRIWNEVVKALTLFSDMVLGLVPTQHHRLLIIRGPARKRETILGIQKKWTVIQERGRGRETNQRTVRQCTKAPSPLGRQDTGRRWYNWIPGIQLTLQETESICAGDPRNREAALEMSPKAAREGEYPVIILLLCLPLAGWHLTLKP